MIFPDIGNVVYLLGRSQNGVFFPLGTCTLLNKPGIFVTASHVINGNDNNLFIKINQTKFGEYQDTDNHKSQCVPAKISAIDPIRDTCLISINNNPVVSNIRISDTDAVNPGDEVTVFGFPHANLGRIVLTQQTCEIGAKILLSNNGVKSKHVVLNIQSRPGQSGSPIIRNSDLSLIGILIGAFVPGKPDVLLGDIDPQSLHQTTHAVSTEYLREML